MKPDHKAALAKCRAWPHKSNTAACYLDAMTCLDKAEKERDVAYGLLDECKARLDKATELLRSVVAGDDDYSTGCDCKRCAAIRAFLERESSG